MRGQIVGVCFSGDDIGFNTVLFFFYEQSDEGVEAILSSCVDDCTLQAAFNTLGGQTAAEAPQWQG